jgi:hypothetical protein
MDAPTKFCPARIHWTWQRPTLAAKPMLKQISWKAVRDPRHASPPCRPVAPGWPRDGPGSHPERNQREVQCTGK